MSILSVQEAIQILQKNIPTSKVITMPILDSLHHILAQDIITPKPIPHFDRAPYDGYALNAPDTGAQGYEYKVVGTIGAGEVFMQNLQSNEALRIMTGAKIPSGANCVVMLEQTTPFASTGETFDKMSIPNITEYSIKVNGIIFPGSNVIKCGEECAAGVTLLKTGEKINAGTISLLASLGYEEVSVYKKPLLALLTSGREVVPLGEELPNHKIYNSNAPMLRSLLRENGFEVDFYHHVSDEPAEIDSEISYLRENLQQIDIVISTGGVSVGDFDFMPQIYEALGSKVLYHRINMRPGAAQYAGCNEKQLFLGLSGNPSAAFNAFHLIALPVLKKAMGEEYSHLKIKCKMGKTIITKNPFDRYIQGRVINNKDELIFYPSEVFTSNAIVGMATANAFYLMPQNFNEINENDEIEVMLLGKSL